MYPFKGTDASIFLGKNHGKRMNENDTANIKINSYSALAMTSLLITLVLF
jgi:hypothetical protein